MLLTLLNPSNVAPATGITYGNSASVGAVGAGIGGSNTITLTKPAGITAGDLLLLYVGQHINNSFPNYGLAPTVPSGFTAVNVPTWAVGNTLAGLYSKIATSSEPASYDVTFNDGGGGALTQLICATLQPVSGLDVTTPINASALGTLSTSGTTGTFPGLTTTVSNCSVPVWGFMLNAPQTTPDGTQWNNVVPTSNTLVASSKFTESSGYIFGALAEKPVAASGAVVAQTVNTLAQDPTSPVEFLGITVALAPAAGVADITGTGTGTLNYPSATGSGLVVVLGSGIATIAAPVAVGSGLFEIAGTGTAIIASPIAVATGRLDVSGSAAVNISPVVSTGTGRLDVSGSAGISISSPVVEADGTAERPEFSGDGTGIIDALIAIASGTLDETGDSVIILPIPILAASGTFTVVGSGVGILVSPEASGDGAVGFEGAGDAELQSLQSTGIGTLDETGSGVGVLSPALASGEAEFYDIGSGVAILPTLEVTGDGHIDEVGSAVAVLPSVVSDGSGQLDESGEASAVLLPPEVLGTGTTSIAGTSGAGDSILPTVGVEATGRLDVSGSASISIPVPNIIAIAIGTLDVSGSGETALVKPEATGSAAFGVAGSGSGSLETPSVTGAGLLGVTGTVVAIFDRLVVVANGSLDSEGSGDGIVVLPFVESTGVVISPVVGDGEGSFQSPILYADSVGDFIAPITGDAEAVLQTPILFSEGTVIIVGIFGSGEASFPPVTTDASGVLEYTGVGSAFISVIEGTGDGKSIPHFAAPIVHVIIHSNPPTAINVDIPNTLAYVSPNANSPAYVSPLTNTLVLLEDDDTVVAA